MNFSLADSLADCPIIAAAKNDEGLEQALSSDSPVVFLLYGSVCSVAGQTRRVAAAGIISTKPALIRRARELGLCAVQRFFVLDSIALENLKRQLENTRPDSIEILPGVMPKVIRRITGFARVPVIAGGLISDKEDIIAALDAGAAAISSTNPAIWFL